MDHIGPPPKPYPKRTMFNFPHRSLGDIVIQLVRQLLHIPWSIYDTACYVAFVGQEANSNEVSKEDVIFNNVSVDICSPLICGNDMQNSMKCFNKTSN